MHHEELPRLWRQPTACSSHRSWRQRQRRGRYHHAQEQKVTLHHLVVCFRPSFPDNPQSAPLRAHTVPPSQVFLCETQASKHASWFRYLCVSTNYLACLLRVPAIQTSDITPGGGSTFSFTRAPPSLSLVLPAERDVARVDVDGRGIPTVALWIARAVGACGPLRFGLAVHAHL